MLGYHITDRETGARSEEAGDASGHSEQAIYLQLVTDGTERISVDLFLQLSSGSAS
jgi:hypothetical protein